ncbi:MAG: FKBP-type peptidyl-prolyl cis-trans isomerase [Minisyncoccia bacterium]
MKTLTRNQLIAVFVSIGLLGYLLFSNLIMNLFNSSPESNARAPETGFVAEDLLLGTGPEAARGDTVVVHYIGSFPDGKIFDSSLDRNVPFEFILGTGSVIRGWDEGIVGMRAGGRRILIIAPDYAYGTAGAGPIPPNSTLIFEVELLEIK